MDGLQGDFLGFQFNGVTSKELGITRVSDGDRYQDILTPEINDRTVEMPGVDGVYFYGSDFKQKTFSVKIAFDGVTEEQLKKIKRTFVYKHIGNLIFSEWPYKVYRVKVASPPELDYVCFNEPDGSGDTYTISTTRKEKYPVLFNENNETVDTFPILLNTTVTTSGEDIETLFEETVSTIPDGGDGWAGFTYSNDINIPRILVTYDGVTYMLDKQTDYPDPYVCAYGAKDTDYDGYPDDFSEYSFTIWSSDGSNNLYTEQTTGTHTVSVATYGVSSTDLNYPSLIDENTLYVTFDGVEYECPQQDYSFDNVTRYDYGAQWSDSLEDYDWSEYPFNINSEIDGRGTLYNTLYTAINGEHSITIKKKEVINRNYVIEEEKPITQRIYKGEGTIEFVAYYPFARQKYRILDTYVAEDLGKETVTDEEINEWLISNQWAAASGIKKASWFGRYVDHIAIADTIAFIRVYNPGDLSTGFKLYIPFVNDQIKGFTMTYDAGIGETTENHVLNIQKITKKDDDVGILINTTNGLIEGVGAISDIEGINDTILTSGNIYNEYATGEFFKIPRTEDPTNLKIITLVGTESLLSLANCKIYYNYLYL